MKTLVLNTVLKYRLAKTSGWLNKSMEFLWMSEWKFKTYFSKIVILNLFLFYFHVHIQKSFKLDPVNMASSWQYKFLIDYLTKFIFLPHAILSMNISGFSEKGHVNCSVYFLSITCNLDLNCIFKYIYILKKYLICFISDL